ISEEFPHLLGHDVSEDHADVRDAGVPQVLEAVEDVRLVRERDELLGSRVRQGPEPGPVAAGQDESFHAGPHDLNRAGGTKLSRLRCSFIAAIPSSAETTAIRCRFAFALVREEFGGRGAFMFRSADRTGLASEGSRAKAFSNRTANSCRLMASAPARGYTPPSASSRSRRLAAAGPAASGGDRVQAVPRLVGDPRR